MIEFFRVQVRVRSSARQYFNQKHCRIHKSLTSTFFQNFENKECIVPLPENALDLL